MEWPRLGELDAVWIRCDPLRRSAGEFPFRSVLGLVFCSFFWLPGDAAGVGWFVVVEGGVVRSRQRRVRRERRAAGGGWGRQRGVDEEHRVE